MSESSSVSRRPGRGRAVTLAAGTLVLVLAVGALLWPGGKPQSGQDVFLVFDSSGDAARIETVYDPLVLYLGELLGRPLDLVVAPNLESFRAQAYRGAALVFCPDGLALGLARDRFLPVVVGRRSAPRNLRPRGVLVYRKEAGLVAEPWRSRPGATVVGDSVSLVATGSWRRQGAAATEGPSGRDACSWGPDPYDHGPVLHAARLGGFDYALVRQWDADRFFSSGLLSPLEWGVDPLTVPVPDVVVLAAVELAANEHLELGDRLSSLGRQSGTESPAAARGRLALRGLGLAGFNLLVEPDFDLVRRNFAADWLPRAD